MSLTKCQCFTCWLLYVNVLGEILHVYDAFYYLPTHWCEVCSTRQECLYSVHSYMPTLKRWKSNPWWCMIIMLLWIPAPSASVTLSIICSFSIFFPGSYNLLIVMPVLMRSECNFLSQCVQSQKMAVQSFSWCQYHSLSPRVLQVPQLKVWISASQLRGQNHLYVIHYPQDLRRI